MYQQCSKPLLVDAEFRKYTTQYRRDCSNPVSKCIFTNHVFNPVIKHGNSKSTIKIIDFLIYIYTCIHTVLIYIYTCIYCYYYYYYYIVIIVVTIIIIIITIIIITIIIIIIAITTTMLIIVIISYLHIFLSIQRRSCSGPQKRRSCETSGAADSGFPMDDWDYIASGKHTKNYGKSPCLMGIMGKSPINEHFQ